MQRDRWAPPVWRPPAPSTGPTALAITDRDADLRRATEELEASKRRLDRDARRAEEATRGQLVSELLPVLDGLDRTLAAGSPDTALLQGVELVRSQLERVLDAFGLERIAAVGARFDPAAHEAVATAPVDDPAQDGVVTDALSRGYRMAGRVLVPARVRVGKFSKQQPAPRRFDETFVA